MSEKIENNAIIHQRKRRKHKIKLLTISLCLMIIGTVTIYGYFKLTKNEYNNYTEKASVNYKANLKENEFYQTDYLDENSTVIASLIKNIDVDFKYNLDLEQQQDYNYSYKIIARTNVKESKKTNSIYETSEELINKDVQESNSKKLEIAENLTIDYNEYNEKMNKFVSLYNLDNITSELELDMYVYVTNKYDGTQINKESKVMTLNIPLTTKTVDISISSNVVQDEGKILSKKSEVENIEYVLWIGIAIVVTGVIILIIFIKYVFDTRSAETMYAQELKQILFNYKTYIQEAKSEINEQNYNIIQINTFNEILGLRDTLQAPILMYTEENEERTKFMIISEGILYVYVLGSKEIRNELRARHAALKAKKKNK